MGLRPGDAPEFFRPSPEAGELCALRADLLARYPGDCLLVTDSGSPSLGEALVLLSEWSGACFIEASGAGRRCEADWVVLAPDDDGVLRVNAGVVCFPSGWSLPEKAGLSVSQVHVPVPRLNEALARNIDTFLARLQPGAVWERDNWGLSADNAPDHHPRHWRNPLAAAATLKTAWLRLERQLFTRLPGGGVLFAIRISSHRLDLLCAAHAGLAARMASALESMLPEVAEYKGITTARETLARQLRELP